MWKILLVGCGGFGGAVCRYLMAGRLQTVMGSSFPWGTLGVNVLGCLLIGVASGLLIGRPGPNYLYMLLVTGFLGGFTTYSAFGLETVLLLNSNRPLAALGYISASLFFGVVAVVVGRLPFA